MCFVVVRGARDACEVPEIALPLVQFVVLAARLEQDDVGRALDEPSAEEHLDAAFAHRRECLDHCGFSRLVGLDLHRRRLVRQRADEAVSVPILFDGDRNLGLDHGVNASDLG